MAHPPLSSPFGMPQEIALTRWGRATPMQKLGQLMWWALGLAMAAVALAALALTLVGPDKQPSARSVSTQAQNAPSRTSASFGAQKAHLVIEAAASHQSE